MNIPIIAIVGPTAVGKTELSIEIAKKCNCEVISIDSVQVYKEFDIGSAKITKEETNNVPHHLIDILDPTDKFSVADFQKIARKKIAEIHNRGKIPLLIGGTGYYMNAVLYDYKFGNFVDEMENENIEQIKKYLKNNYPNTYEKIDINNERRLINAYRYVLAEKKEAVENNEGTKLYANYRPYLIILNREREIIYERINKRVELMFDLGLEEEVKTIVENYGTDVQAMSSIGYKEFIGYFSGEYTKEELIKIIQQNSRRYAKRQLTWFRNKMINPVWYDMQKDDKKKILTDIENFLMSNNYANTKYNKN